MATTKHRFAIGDPVKIKHAESIYGIVTAIWIREEGVSYEIGYTLDKPTHITVQEVELERSQTNKLGFSKKQRDV